MAKALVGGLSLMMAMSDGRIKPDDLASKYLPGWRDDPQKRGITIRHLSTHTSGIEDAEADGLPHERLTGWKGDFWKRLDPPRDPFTIARDLAPALDPPGTRARYSNAGMALLAYCVTASLRGAPDADLRALLKHRIMDPLGIRETEWSCGYGAATQLDGVALVASWGGGAYSPNATARVGLLMLQRGAWGGKQLIPRSVVEEATAHAGMPGNSGLGGWVNRRADGTLEWKSAPEDAFWGAGAGHQFLWVVPSLNLIAVRNGENLDKGISFDEGLETYIVAPLIKSLFSSRVPTYPPSPVIKQIQWAPRETIRRQARGSDNWPLTWADDDQLYTAYGDGNGFDPNVPEKLSLGFARVTGSATEFAGVNIRSATGEQKGDGEAGKKASGILMVDGILYLWARNAGNSQLAWSADHGVTWTWSEWTFKTSFGSPTFLNFGRNYAGSRDGFVYVYSHDSDSAYSPADRMVLARAPKERIKSRDAYEFFNGLDPAGAPVWTSDIQERGAVFVHAGRCYRS